ncbi:MAG TPA: alpha/beta hydrolase [Planctomycetes bacterium]|nr:alpha/beta hydrolase [Planctomycetota bacterium]
MSIREYPMSTCQPELIRISRLEFSIGSRCTAVVLLISLCPAAFGQPDRPLDPIAAGLQPTRTLTYKQVDDIDLKMHVFEPAGHMASDRRGVFLIIHGGGWAGGNPRRGYPFADYFRERDMVAISIEYRLLQRSGTPTVFECVKDGRSAVRYLRQHSGKLGIDPQKIVVAGCSAGGHVAAGTALFSGVDEQSDDTAISCVPNALVLYYPVIDTSSKGYGQKKIGAAWQQISPVHHVRANLPPTIVFHGTADTVTPYTGAVLFRDRMVQAGNRCELESHKDGGHGYLIFDLGLFQQATATTQQFIDEVLKQSSEKSD